MLLLMIKIYGSIPTIGCRVGRSDGGAGGQSRRRASGTSLVTIIVLYNLLLLHTCEFGVQRRIGIRMSGEQLLNRLLAPSQAKERRTGRVNALIRQQVRLSAFLTFSILIQNPRASGSLSVRARV